MRSIFVFAIILVFQTFDCHARGNQNGELNNQHFFDMDLLREAMEDKKENILLSPASLKSTLAMLLEGARNTTAAELKSVLRLTPTHNDYKDELKTYLQGLQINSSTVVLHNANAMFVSKKVKLRKEYETTVKRSYFSEINQLDFQNPSVTANTINGWVSSRTKGLIPTIIDEVHVPPTTEMVITNALYFKAPWKYGFNPKATYEDCFYNNGVCRNTTLMLLKTELNCTYVKELRAHAVELPYKGDRYSMILIVPRERDGIEDVIRNMAFVGLPEVVEQLELNDAVVIMPKFTIDYGTNMVETLKKMRIRSLFSESADLSGMFESGEAPNLNIIYHSVHMTVDEEGTVAAAATASVFVPLYNKDVQIRADRPFLFFIRDNELGSILFEGRIEEPHFDETSVKGPQQPQEDSQRTALGQYSSKLPQKLIGADQTNINQGDQSQHPFNKKGRDPILNPESQIQTNFNQGHPSKFSHNHEGPIPSNPVPSDSISIEKYPYQASYLQTEGYIHNYPEFTPDPTGPTFFQADYVIKLETTTYNPFLSYEDIYWRPLKKLNKKFTSPQLRDESAGAPLALFPSKLPQQKIAGQRSFNQAHQQLSINPGSQNQANFYQGHPTQFNYNQEYTIPSNYHQGYLVARGRDLSQARFHRTRFYRHNYPEFAPDPEQVIYNIDYELPEGRTTEANTEATVSIDDIYRRPFKQ